MSHTTTWLNTLRPCVLGLIFLTLLAACDPDAPLATPAPDNAASTAKVTTASATEETTPPSRPAIAKSSEADREALVALYNATDGENWNGSHNWLSDAPLGEWDGVTTDDDGRVTALALYSNGLIGEIPAELGGLSNLRSLDLYSNGLIGEIPAELGSLSNLGSLDLVNNELSGKIPAELASLSNLKSLNLGNNELSGEIPPELGSLSNLGLLNLANNELSGEIPPELGSLSNLRDLYLDDNALSGCVPSSLEDQLSSSLSHLGVPFC